MEMQEEAVIHDPDNSRFVYRDGDAGGQLIYRLDGDRLLLTHTQVDVVLRGRGVAGRLVRAAAEHAADGGLVVVPVCPYTRNWLEDHRSETDRTAIDWSGPAPEPQ